MRVILFLLSVALATGCSSSSTDPNALTPHPVTGKVMYDGKPAAGVIVTFLPIDAPTVPQIPRNPQGTTKEDGTFSLTTYKEEDGAPEGGYQIILHWPGAKNEEAEGEAGEDTDRLLGWYDGTHSLLSHRVKAGANTVPVINLSKVDKPPPASQGVPGRN